MSDRKNKAESYNLDLEHSINKEALGRIDIDAFLKCCQDVSSSQAFNEAICNEQKCPIGWEECQGKGKLDCWYFELVSSIFNDRKSRYS